jgi:hypothetical protein
VHQVGYKKLIDIMMHGQRNIKTCGYFVACSVCTNKCDGKLREDAMRQIRSCSSKSVVLRYLQKDWTALPLPVYCLLQQCTITNLRTKCELGTYGTILRQNSGTQKMHLYDTWNPLPKTRLKFHSGNWCLFKKKLRALWWQTLQIVVLH